MPTDNPETLSWQEAYERWLKSKTQTEKNRIAMNGGTGEAIIQISRLLYDKPTWYLKVQEVAKEPREAFAKHLDQEAMSDLADIFRFFECVTPDSWHQPEPPPAQD